jgi:large subunit ribosomal protein L4
MEPLRFEQFPSTFLYAPLRRDILHKAVVFEGDAHRLGRANAKTRGEVRGSSRKIRPQKGTGKARLGDKKSPMLRGGGVAHGPRPRDFSSDLPRQMYDMAWRTALSYRYRRAELIVVDNTLELQEPDAGLAKTILKKYGWGNEGLRSLLITADRRPNLESAMSGLGSEGRVLTADEVDVKDLVSSLFQQDQITRENASLTNYCSWKWVESSSRRRHWYGSRKSTASQRPLPKWLLECIFV